MKITKSDYYKCHYCGKYFRGRHITKDHFVASSNGGSNKKENIKLACKWCNFLKADKKFTSIRQVKKFIKIYGNQYKK